MVEPDLLSHRLAYQIHSHSGYTSSYSPDRILIDAPSDTSSRWTGTPRQGPLSAGTEQGHSRREVQYITLKLDAPSVVSAIGFGKHHKVHPCNLQEFSILGGMSPDRRYMRVLLEHSLKNDSIKEKFALPTGLHGDKSVPQPVRYLRIEALSPHQQNYNVAIWHVWLEGTNDATTMESVVAAYDEHRARTTHHLVLSHLRRTNQLAAFALLRDSSPLSANFEHPLISQMHDALVIHGRFANSPDGVEATLHAWREAGLFREWSPGGGKGRPVARWERVSADTGAQGGPVGRGGHQMVKVGRTLLLFGGWDGERDLGDVWSWELPRQGEAGFGGPWRKVHDSYEGKEAEEGERPRGRSCHQMAVDDAEGWVYMFGGLAGSDDDGDEDSDTDADSVNVPILQPAEHQSPAQRSPRPADDPVEEAGRPMDLDRRPSQAAASLERLLRHPRGEEEAPQESRARRPRRRAGTASDLWRFRAVGPGRGEWELVSADTSKEGGPARLWDHGMVVGRGGESLFVFGGKVEKGREEEGNGGGAYGGLYEYSLRTKKWRLHLADPGPHDEFKASRLLGRLGHALVHDPTTSSLYVLGGQRGESFKADFWHIPLSPPSDSPSAPFDSPALMASLLSSDTSKQGGPPLSFAQRATVHPETGAWTVLSGSTQVAGSQREVQGREIWVRPEGAQGGGWEEVERRGEEPVGRFAGQVVYDPLRKEHWMFGGNPADEADKGRRLGDFWRLKVTYPSAEEALRKATFLIRRQRFAELCLTSPPLLALEYLQTTLSSVVDHSDDAEAEAFRGCMTSLLTAPPRADVDMDGSVASLSSGGNGNGGGEVVDGLGPELEGTVYAERQALFERLVGEFVPRGEGAEGEDLRDLCTSGR